MKVLLSMCYSVRMIVAGSARRSVMLLIFFGLLSRSVPAQAQFIQTSSSGVYQSGDGRVKIVLASQEGAQGILVAHLAQGIQPQEFNVEKVPANGSSHVFIKFDPSSEYNYSELLIGEKSYKVNGNLNLSVGPVKVKLDNTNPYLTITYRAGDAATDSLLGFYGLVEVVKGSGNLAAIVAANQYSAETAKILKPYSVLDGALWLGGKKVENPTVGIFMKRENVCLKDTTSLLTLEQLKQIQSAKGEVQQAQLLEGFLKTNKKTSPLLRKLVLRADPSSPVVMLDMSQNVYDLRQIKNSFSRNIVCVISPIS